MRDTDLLALFSSPTNTTTTPLTAGATYTGDWYQNTDYTSIIVAAITDKVGTLYIDQSVDGSNVDSTASYAVAAATSEVHHLTMSRKWVRVRFTNTSGDTQTYLRLSTSFSNASLLTAPLNSTVQQDADGIVVRAIPAELEIAFGRFQNMSITNKVGLNPDIDIGTVPEDVWDGGGVYPGFPTGSAEVVRITSSDAADTAAGTGARTVRVTGLDTNYDVQSEDITLSGTTPAVGTLLFRRIHTARVLTAGSGGVNAGTLTCQHNVTTANIFFVMAIGINQTNVMAFTVPAGYTAYIQGVRAAIRGAHVAQVYADLQLWIREFNGVFRARRPMVVNSNTPFNDVIFGGISVTEKSDITVRCTSVSASNLAISASMDLLVVKN